MPTRPDPIRRRTLLTAGIALLLTAPALAVGGFAEAGDPSAPALPPDAGPLAPAAAPPWTPARMEGLLRGLEAGDPDAWAPLLARGWRMNGTALEGFAAGLEDMDEPRRDAILERLHRALRWGDLPAPPQPPQEAGQSGQSASPEHPEEGAMTQDDGATAAAARPRVAMGIDRAAWGAGSMNYVAAGKNQDWGLCYGGSTCFHSLNHATDYRVLSNADRQANIYTRTVSGTVLLPSAINLLANSGKVLGWILEDVHRKDPTDQQVWAAIGMQYDFVRGCAEQETIVSGRAHADYNLRGELFAGVGAAFGFAFSEVDLRWVPYTSKAQPLDAVGSAPLLFRDSAYVHTTFFAEKTTKPYNRFSEGSYPINAHAGQGTTYLIVSGTSLTESAIFGLGKAHADFYWEDKALHATRLSLSWPDSTPPVASASVSALAGNNGWWRSDATVVLEAEDPQTCVDALEYRVDNGAWKRVDVSPWFPKASVPVRGDGVHKVQYRAQNHDGDWSAARTVTVRIDARPPSVTLTTPRAGHCYAQDVEVPTLAATCATGTHLTMRASATDATSGVDLVDFQVQGRSVATDGLAPYSGRWQLLTLPVPEVGSRSTRACAEDHAGNRACDTGPSVLALA